LDCFGTLGVITVALEGHKHTIKWETNLISIPWSQRRYCLIIFELVMLRCEYSKSAVFSLSSVTGTAKVESEWHVPSYQYRYTGGAIPHPGYWFFPPGLLTKPSGIVLGVMLNSETESCHVMKPGIRRWRQVGRHGPI